MSAGAWIVYSTDWNDYPISLWPDELAARRAADDLGYGKVAFWAWGDWEGRQDREPEPSACSASYENQHCCGGWCE